VGQLNFVLRIADACQHRRLEQQRQHVTPLRRPADGGGRQHKFVLDANVMRDELRQGRKPGRRAGIGGAGLGRRGGSRQKAAGEQSPEQQGRHG